MKWQKRGLVYTPTGEKWWARSYATIPTADVLNEEVIRVYFAALDDNQFGRIGYVDLDAKCPERVMAESQEPVLDLGPLGSFDDSGVNPSCILNVNGKKYLYYIGWQRCERVPYMLFAGLARQQADGSFLKHAPTPVLDRTPDEPFSRSAPFVLFHEGIFKMWYWSCREWIKGKEGVHYYNVLRYATSTDAISWQTHSHVCVRPNPPDEFSIGRPAVIVNGSSYQMWYSIRSFTRLYTIGYAESNDGIHWKRKDEEAGIDKSDDGWDAEMICYPFVVGVRGTLYMFYNGNRHGATGFGYAILEDEGPK